MFPIGQLTATPGVLAFCREHGINPLHVIARHVARDWAQMDPYDRKANERALEEGSRVFSAFTYRGENLWVITEADRSLTTLLLSHEY
jgi:hypothetical protein